VEQGSFAALPGSVELSAARERRLRWQVRLKLMLLVSRYTSFRHGRTLNTFLRPMLSETTYIVRYTPCLRIEPGTPLLMSPREDTAAADRLVRSSRGSATAFRSNAGKRRMSLFRSYGPEPRPDIAPMRS
jgi:hypothetical protein